MSVKRVVIAALVAAAAVPAPAAFATYVDNPGPRAAGDTSSTGETRVLRDQGAPAPPPVVAATHDEPAGGFPWAEAAIPAGLVVLVAAGAGMDRRRRAAA